MSSTLVTNLDLSEPQEVLDTEVRSKESNDSFTLNSEDQEEEVQNLSEEKQKDKDLELETIVEEKKQSVVEEQQKDNDNVSVIKESLNQEEQYEENSTATNAITNETNETESISEGNKDQSEWTAVWDDNAQAYYYWNVVTNETTWENPNSNNLMAQTINSEYSNYYYSQYGYYPEAYYYGYDNFTTSSDMAATEVTTEPPTNPLDSLLDKIDKEVKSKLDRNSSKKQSSTSDTQHNDQQDQQQEQDQQEETSLISSSTDLDHYHDQYQMATNDPDYQSFLAEHGGNDGSTEYKLTARFNAKTGKFQRDPTLNPEKFSAESKAIRQMSYFFDYDQFAETRGSASNKRLSSDTGDSIRSPKKLNKKDIEMFKQKKKEKKDMKKKSWLLSEND